MKSNKIRLGEQCVVTSSKRFHLSERITQGVPFYCSKEIIKKFNGEDVTECDYISEDLYKKVSNEFGVPKENDLLITTRGTIGIPYLYKRTDRFYFADGNLTWIKDFDSNLYSKFLYYWFQSYEGRKKFEALAKGTAQKAVPISGIKTLEIELPSLKSQKRIADILSAYDDLIENNRKQIKLLEEAAQRLYKEWFVDLHFPGHENTKIVDGVPEGWSKNPIQDFISYEIGGGWGEELQNEKSMIPAYVIRGTDIKGLVNPASVFPFLREHLNSLDKGLHKLLLLRFRCGMVDFIKCQQQAIDIVSGNLLLLDAADLTLQFANLNFDFLYGVILLIIAALQVQNLSVIVGIIDVQGIHLTLQAAFRSKGLL